MNYRFAGFILLQISLGNICCIFRTMYEYVIPGLVLGRSRFGDALVPFLATHKYWIHVKYDSSIFEQAVMNRLTYMKQCLAAFGCIYH